MNLHRRHRLVSSGVRCAVAVLVLTLGLLALSGMAAASDDITECATIDEPGAYEITEDLEVTGDGPCLNVTASDVHVDGQNNEIDGAAADAVEISGADVSLEDVVVSDVNVPVSAEDTTGVAIKNVSIIGPDYPATFDSVEDIDATGVDIYDADDEGIVFIESSDVNLERFSIRSDQEAIGLGEVDDSTFVNGVIYSEGDEGIDGDGDHNQFADLTIGSGDEAIDFDGVSNDLHDLTINSRDEGIELDGAENRVWNASIVTKDEGVDLGGDDNQLWNLSIVSEDVGLTIGDDENSIEDITVTAVDSTGIIIEGYDNHLQDIGIEAGTDGMYIGSDDNSLQDIDVEAREDGIELGGDRNLLGETDIEVNKAGITGNGDENYLEDLSVSAGKHASEQEGDGTTFSGLTLASGDDGIRHSGDSVTIEDIIIESGRSGLNLEGSGISVSDVIIDSGEYGLEVDGTDASVSDVTIDAERHGLVVDGTDASVSDVTIDAAWDGLKADGSDHEYEDISVTAVWYGVVVSDTGVEFSDGSIDAGDDGILVEADDLTVQDSTVASEDGAGVLVDRGTIGTTIGATQLDDGLEVEGRSVSPTNDTVLEAVEMGDATVSTSIGSVNDDVNLDPVDPDPPSAASLSLLDGSVVYDWEDDDDVENVEVSLHYDNSDVDDPYIASLEAGDWDLLEDTDVDSGEGTATAALEADGTYGVLEVGENAIMECRTIDSAGTYDVVTDLTANESCLVPEADGITMKGHGHVITGGEEVGNFDRGVDIWDREEITVADLVIEGWSAGVYLAQVTDVTVANVTSVDNTHGIRSTEFSEDVVIDGNTLLDNNEDQGSTGVGLLDTSNATVSNNTIQNSPQGISDEFGFNNTIRGNEQTNTMAVTEAGVHVEQSAQTTIERTSVEQNDFDMRVVESEGVAIDEGSASEIRLEDAAVETSAVSIGGTPVSFDGEGNVILESAGSPDPPSDDHVDLEEAVELSQVAGSVDIGIHYTDGQAPMVDGDMELHQDDGDTLTDLGASDDAAEQLVMGSTDEDGTVGLYGEAGNVIEECGAEIDESGEWGVASDFTADDSPCIEITASDVRLYGNHNEIDGDDNDAVVVTGDDATVTDLAVVDSTRALEVDGASGVTLADVHGADLEEFVVFVDADEGTLVDGSAETVDRAVSLQGSSDTVVSSVEFDDVAEQALEIDDGSHEAVVADVAATGLASDAAPLNVSASDDVAVVDAHFDSANRPLTVEGADNTTIANVTPRIEGVVVEEGPRTTLSGLEILGAGIDIDGGHEATVTDVEILSGGGSLEDVDGGTVAEVTVDDGFSLSDSQDVVIEDALIDEGMSLSDTTDSYVSDIEVDRGDGLSLENSQENVFTGVTVLDSEQHGTEVTDSSSDNVFSNVLIDDTEDGYDGLSVQGEGNVFENVYVDHGIGSHDGAVARLDDAPGTILDGLEADESPVVVADSSPDSTYLDMELRGSELFNISEGENSTISGISGTNVDGAFVIEDSPESELSAISVTNGEAAGASSSPNIVFDVDDSPDSEFVDISVATVDHVFDVSDSDSSEIANLTVTQAEDVLEIDDSSHTTVTDVDVRAVGDVVQAYRSSFLEINDLTAVDVGDVVELRTESEDGTIRNLSVNRVGDVIEVDSSDRGHVEGVDATHVDGEGLEIDESDTTTVEDVSFDWVYRTGFEVEESTGVDIDGLTVTGATELGEIFDGSFETTITNSSFRANSYGLEIDDDATGDTTIAESEFVGTSDTDLVVSDTSSTGLEGVTMDDSIVSLEIADGSIGANVMSLEPSEGEVLGSHLEVDPMGASIDLEHHYEDVDEDTLSIWDAIGDEHLETTIYEDDAVASASLSGWGIYGLVGEADDDIEPVPIGPPPDDDDEPAEFVASDHEIFPTELVEGETVTATMTIQNVGDESGTSDIALTEGDTVHNETTVSLEGGQSEEVALSMTAEEPGTLELELDGEALEAVTVEEEGDDEPADDEPTDDDEADDTDEEDSGVPSSAIVLIGLVAVAGAGAAGWLYTQGRLDGFLGGGDAAGAGETESGSDTAVEAEEAAVGEPDSAESTEDTTAEESSDESEPGESGDDSTSDEETADGSDESESGTAGDDESES